MSDVFWQQLPMILTAVAAVISALTGGIVVAIKELKTNRTINEKAQSIETGIQRNQDAIEENTVLTRTNTDKIHVELVTNLTEQDRVSKGRLALSESRLLLAEKDLKDFRAQQEQILKDKQDGSS